MRILKGDRQPSLDLYLKRDGAAINLTTASSVAIRLADQKTGILKFSSAGTIAGATTGNVTYAWGATDTTTVGDYDLEVEVTWSAGVTETVKLDEVIHVIDKAVVAP